MKLLNIIAMGMACIFMLSGCNTVGVGGHVGVPVEKQQHRKKGPPPHAPAHGYRHNHQGHDLDYDAKIGAYIVINVPDTYFHNNMYIRLSTDGRWMVSANLNNGWRVETGTEIPHRLKYRQKHKDKKNKINKGQSKKYD